VEGQGVLPGWHVTKDGEDVCIGPYVTPKRREIACESRFRLGLRADHEVQTRL
jgi:hypothetical protein